MTSSLIAIDIGSSQTRVTVFSIDGRTLAEGSRPTIVESDAPGFAELDVERLWRDTADLIAEVAGAGQPVRGIGVVSQLGIVLLEPSGKAMDRAILWPDTRARDEAAELEQIVGDDSRRIAGRRVTPELLAPRLMWFRRHRPDLLARTSHVISLKDYIVQRLTGEISTDETHASYSGLFDVDRRRWSDTLFGAAGCDPGLLPPVLPATARAGAVSAAAASRIGVPSGTAVAVGTSDGTAGVVGAGAVRAGVTVDVAGTTDTVLHSLAAPLRDPRAALIVNAHAVADLWTVGGPTGLTGGAAVWQANVLGFTTPDEVTAALSEALAAVPPGSQGLLFRPALTGSRFPDWQSSERGVLAGLSFGHGPLHLLRAAQEGAAFTVAEAVDAIRSCGSETHEMIVVGGLASSAAALQLRADVLGIPVVSLANQQASSAGAAMIAGVCANAYADLTEAADALVTLGRRFTPDGRTAPIFDEAAKRWRAIRFVE